MADDKPTALVPFEGFKSELIARQDEIGALLPSTISREAFVNTAIVAVKTNPALLECDRRSLHAAVTKAAQDGMKPDGREGVIIPQKEDGKLSARWAPMAYGIRKRAKELDGIIVDTQIVHENDRFVWTQGDDARIEHAPAPLGTDRGKAVGVYAIVRRGAEVLLREVMSEADIAAVRAISKQPNGLMWGKFTGEAWRKTVLRRAMKSVPVSDALRTVIERDHDEFDLRDITPEAPRLPPVKGPAIMVTWRAGEPVEHVPVREFHNRVLAFIGSAEASVVLDWARRNTLGLREFWGIDKDAALAIKAEIEKVAAREEPKEEPTAPAPAEAAADIDDREIVLHDLIAEVSKEPDAKKRNAIWADSEKARAAMTDQQVARLKAALDQMESVAGKAARKREAA